MTNESFWKDSNELVTGGASFIGSLVAFSRLNLSEKRKMFMGDTGSMVIGFSIAMYYTT